MRYTHHHSLEQHCTQPRHALDSTNRGPKSEGSINNTLDTSLPQCMTDPVFLSLLPYYTIASAGGMGKEMCKAFALGGAHVVIASRKLESCELLADEINDRPDCSGTALPVAFNASDWGDCNRLVERVYHEFGRVDVLVNNAGGSPLYPSLSEISEELFDSKFHVCAFAPAATSGSWLYSDILCIIRGRL